MDRGAEMEARPRLGAVHHHQRNRHRCAIGKLHQLNTRALHGTGLDGKTFTRDDAAHSVHAPTAVCIPADAIGCFVICVVSSMPAAAAVVWAPLKLRSAMPAV